METEKRHGDAKLHEVQQDLENLQQMSTEKVKHWRQLDLQVFHYQSNHAQISNAASFVYFVLNTLNCFLLLIFCYRPQCS